MYAPPHGIADRRLRTADVPRKIRSHARELITDRDQEYTGHYSENPAKPRAAADEPNQHDYVRG
jgi:hypothetical protein